MLKDHVLQRKRWHIANGLIARKLAVGAILRGNRRLFFVRDGAFDGVFLWKKACAVPSLLRP